jgi:hypothetical protein
VPPRARSPSSTGHGRRSVFATSGRWVRVSDHGKAGGGATASTADIVAIARGAGIANSHWVRDETHFDELSSRRFAEGGPVLLAAKIDAAPGVGQTVRDPPLIRPRFMRGLGTGRASALDG